MKKIVKRIGAVFALIAVFAMSAVTVFAADASKGELDTGEKVSFSVSCSKSGYTFNVYRLASLEKSSTSPFDVKYTALARGLQSAVDEGVNSKKDGSLSADDSTAASASNAVLRAADSMDEEDLSVLYTGTYSYDTDGASKTFSDLPQGIYYVRAMQCPSNVRNTTNSVFALPYYDGTSSEWVYMINTIPLASKVSETGPDITKKIDDDGTLKDHKNVSAGDKIKFVIDARITGSSQHPLTAFSVKDTAEKGIALPGTVKVELFKDGETEAFKTLTSDEYTYEYTSDEGRTNTGTVTLDESVLSSDFGIYECDYVRVSLVGTLTKYAEVTDAGNDNTSEYTWCVDGESETMQDDDETKVYTQALEITKENESGEKLSGAHFSLCSDSACTKEIASGVSDENGKTVFKNASGDTVLLSAGTYYAKETQSPSGYSRYSDVIEIVISDTYKDVYSDGTWVSARTAKANGTSVSMNGGTVSFTVTNSKVILPQTGGMGNVTVYAVSAVIFMAGLAGIAVSKKRKKDM